jgi:hypothetical protein
MIRRFVPLAVASVLGFTISVARAEPLFFQATVDQSNMVNYSWFSQNNWYRPDPNNMGHFVHCQCLPTPDDDTYILTTVNAAGPNNITVKSLNLGGGGDTLSNGVFDVGQVTIASGGIAGIGNAQYISGTVFHNVRDSFTVIGADLYATGTTIIIQGGGFFTWAFDNFGTKSLSIVSLSGGSTLFLQGDLVMIDSAHLGFDGSGALNVQPGAAVRASGGAALLSGGGSPGATFNLDGTVQVNGGTLTIDGLWQWTSNQGLGKFRPFTSDAFIDIISPITVPQNAVFAVEGLGLVRTERIVTLDGTLQVGVIDPSTNIAEPGTFELGNFMAASQRLTGGGTLHVMGGSVFNWTSGNIQSFTGVINIDANATLNLIGGPTGFSTTFDGGTLNNAGTVTWTSNQSVDASSGAVINNLAGGLFDLKSDSRLTGTIQNTPTFNNFGTLRKSAGIGTFRIGTIFNNSGTLDLLIGTTSIYQFTQSAGVTNLDGGNLSNAGFGTPFIFNGGTLIGSGTVTGQTINNGAIFGPGHSPGKITIAGNFTQNSGGELDIEVAGITTPGVDYDLLEITGNATLGGAFRVTDINGFQPTGTDTIMPLTANSISGTFDSTNTQVTYGPTSITAAALPAPSPLLLNISTRLRVLTGDNVLIGGFIVTGTDPKKVIVRGLGPSLTSQGVPGALSDPTLELHDGTGATLATNDNWKDTQQSEIEATTIPPTNDLESAIVATLPANNAAYTAILRGKNDTTGIGLVEVYDLDQAANSQLANISTRGFVDTGDNVMIGGFIIGPSNAFSGKIVVRAIGPSLTNQGVANALQDPTLELHDGSGATIASNDNWKDTQQSDIEATTIPPTNDLESAIVATLTPGNYTAIVRGKNNTTGVALVEVYNLQ